MRSIRILSALFVCLFAMCKADAQLSGEGVYPLGSFDSKGFDTINLGNLNIHFEIPIVQKKGRGGSDFVYKLVYDGLIWSPTSASGASTWTNDPTWGLRGQLIGGSIGYITYSAISKSCPRPPNTSGPYINSAPGQTNYVFHDPSGGSHRFNYKFQNPCETDANQNPTITGDGSSSDGSGYSLNTSTYAVNTRDGLIIAAPISTTASAGNGSITDRNGNLITESVSSSTTYKDTTGANILIIGGSGTSSSPLTYQVEVAGQAANNYSNTYATTTVYFKAYTVSTAFKCGVGETTASANLLDHIVLPDGSHSTYTFTYEATPGGVSGRLASITLPSGGVITYTYSGGCSGTGMNGDGTPQTLVRKTSDGSKTYTRGLSAGSAVSTGQAYDEAGNRTDFTFETSTNGNTYEDERQVFTGNPSGGTPLYDRTTFYNNVSGAGQITAPLTEADAYEVYNSSNSNGGLKQLRTNSAYSASGLLLSSTALDTAAGTIPITSSHYSYNGVGEPLSVQTWDNQGNVVTSTSYQYDNPAYTLKSTSSLNLPQRTTVGGTRGNLTNTHVMVASGVTLDSSATYDDTGQITTSTAPDGGVTSYSYETTTNTFLKSTTYPTLASGVTLATTMSFEPYSGAVINQTGMNAGQTTTVTQYDPLMRPLTVTLPISGAQVTSSYSPTQTSVSATRDTNPNTATNQITLVDGYGRTKRTAVWNGTNYYLTDTCYGPTGSVQNSGVTYVSSSVSAGQNCSNGSSYQYDALGRELSESHADGSSTAWQYFDHAIKQTDTPGTTKIIERDLIGRTTAICEVSAGASAGSETPVACGLDITGYNGFLTNYSYNLASHLVTIVQGAQTRSFQTDGAGRQTKVVEPESGTTNYYYAYSGGLIVTRKRPQANVPSSTGAQTTTTSSYDQLGRLLTVAYANDLPSYQGVALPTTPTRTFSYDQNGNGGSIQSGSAGAYLGQLTQMSNGIHGRSYAYDLLGRVSETVECLPDWCGNGPHDVYRFYGYDYIGNLTSDRYGTVGNAGTSSSYATITYGYNNASQLTSMGGGQDLSTPTIYGATTSSMLPFGPQTASFGNGLIATSQYDAVGRESGRWLCGSPGGVNCPSPSTYSFGFAVHQVGSQVQWETDTTINRFTDYSYDDMGRLKGGTSHSGQQGINLAANYDRYGNRWSQTVSNTATNQVPNDPSLMFTAATNQINNISGLNYDGAGNMTSDGMSNYQFDAENNLLSVSGGYTAVYAYNGLNQRMKVQTSAGTDRYGLDLTGRRSTTWLDGTGPTTLKLTQYYSDRGAVGFWSNSDSHIHFEHGDWLGTDHIRTNNTGATESTFATLPFGDNVGATGSDLAPGHFASLDQDFGIGAPLHHAMYREYSASLGRWTSPDPYEGSYDATNPQSFNRYSYVLSNPLALTDPSGQDYIDSSGNPCSTTTVQDSSGHFTTTLTCYTNGPPSPQGGPLPWWLTEYGSYGQPGGQCLLSNGGVATCPNPTTAPSASKPPPAPSNLANAAKTVGKYAGCAVVGGGAGLQSFFGLPSNLQNGPPGVNSVIRPVRAGLNVAAPTLITTAGEVGGVAAAEFAADAIPVVGEILLTIQTGYALYSGAKAFYGCVTK